ncbi:hypothetical protein O6H91_21G001600 [Diphasiastrum complanatum]|uniref:Uncharacterized protein n=2 Tax=Diphasiastrum complanatum TaxID=34168 RepID=A0ACC2AH97_DIPCM|nr:hypothetical protein O6H91_21G001600 [Diphasiastrum complanatum]
MPRLRVVSRATFMDMVASLPASKLDRLYDSHWTCQAILRSLTPLAKQYVMRMLYIDAPIPNKSLQEWVLPDATVKHKVAIDKLEQLRILVDVSERKKEVTYRLNPKLQNQLRSVLKSGGGIPRDPMPSSIVARLPTATELENYAIQQWELVILQLVNSASGEGPTAPLNKFIQHIFQKAGLLTSRENETTSRITEAGFQFLLLERSSQLWQIIREYVSAAEERGLDNGELIGFLLELGFHIVGEPYNMNTLTGMQQKAVEELAILGLARVQQGMKDRWFIPTKLAASLSTNLSESSSWQPTEGFVVVETNFRVYGYTSSKLQTETLRLFVRLEYQLPNLVVGSLTKESINSAFASGINAEQIISFLQKHAHPHVAPKVPTVPETVSDQIRLWETDRNRLQLLPAYVYEDFPSMDIFQAVVAYARDIQGLLWEDASTRRVVVRGELHEDVRSFLHRQNTASSQRK